MKLFGIGKPKDDVLKEKVKNLKQELTDLKLKISKTKQIISLEDEIKNQTEKLKNIQHEISLANDELGFQEFGFFERQYKFSNSTKYKEELEKIRNYQKQHIKNNTAGNIISPMMLNNNKSKGRAMQKQLIRAAIRGFNGEADALLVKITVSNLDNKIKALKKAFSQLNKMYSRNQIEISSVYLELKIKELQLAAEYELEKQHEKELLKEQREKEREDKKLQNEIKTKRKQIEKDRKHFNNMIKNVEELLKNANDDEILELKRQISEYRERLSELDDIEENIDYREGHATAGYVYVISNIGSFGKDIYKIGVTRRLEPLDRIRELSSASVPFQFDVHALVFSEEAFALERELHTEFEKYKINKVNGRKEYFKVPFQKIKDSLAKHKELTIEFTEEPEAFEYRQSISNKI